MEISCPPKIYSGYYLALFSNPIPKADREAIRTATSKAQGLGNHRFKAKVKKMY